MADAHDVETLDVGNILHMEHLNVCVPDQLTATLFYIVGMGFTRDPYNTVGVDNMHVNVGEQQFHLPTRGEQVVNGHVGLVVPDLDALEARLRAVEGRLAGTQFAWSREGDHVNVTCPWGNTLRCHAPGPQFKDMTLGMPYVEILVKPGTAEGIARFYRQVMQTPATVQSCDEGQAAVVKAGRNQCIVFQETTRDLPAYPGYHVAVYVANFSGPYNYLKERGLLTEDIRNHQFRFQAIVDPQTGDQLCDLEHEVRNMHHPQFRRVLVNREAGAPAPAPGRVRPVAAAASA